MKYVAWELHENREIVATFVWEGKAKCHGKNAVDVARYFGVYLEHLSTVEGMYLEPMIYIYIYIYTVYTLMVNYHN